MQLSLLLMKISQCVERQLYVLPTCSDQTLFAGFPRERVQPQAAGARNFPLTLGECAGVEQ